MPEPAQMQKLLSAVAAMTDEMSKMSHQLNAVEAKVDEAKDIIEAWNAMKVGGKFIKWLGGIATALAALWLIMKVGISHYLPGGKP